MIMLTKVLGAKKSLPLTVGHSSGAEIKSMTTAVNSAFDWISNGPQAPEARRAMQALRSEIDGKLSEKADCRIVAFASAQPGEGKTTILGEFATLLLSTKGSSILVIDAGFRQDFSSRYAPESAMYLQRLDGGKIETPIAASDTGRLVTVRIELFNGTVMYPTDDLAALDRRLKELAPLFDYILIDLPSMLTQPWSVDVGRLTHGMVLVVEAEHTRWPVVEQMRRACERVGAPILGLFLNKRRYYIPKRIYERL